MRIQLVFLMGGLVLVNLATTFTACGAQHRSDLFNVSDLEHRPVPIKRVSPRYPYEMAKAGIGGAVVVEFVIDTSGDVTRAEVIQSSDKRFELEALNAVTQWKFTPGDIRGRKVNTRAVQLLEFDLAADLVYPFELLRDGGEGTAAVKFLVDAYGRPTRIWLISATKPEFGGAAIAAVTAGIYAPPLNIQGQQNAPRQITLNFVAGGRGDAQVSGGAKGILSTLKNHPEEIITASQLDQPPKPIFRAPPVYPLDLQTVGQTGEALIEFFIDRDGGAQLPRIVSSSAPEFGYAAVQAVATWRYEAPRKNGKTVVTRVRIPLEFSLPPAPTPKPHS